MGGGWAGEDLSDLGRDNTFVHGVNDYNAENSIVLMCAKLRDSVNYRTAQGHENVARHVADQVFQVNLNLFTCSKKQPPLPCKQKETSSSATDMGLEPTTLALGGPRATIAPTGQR